MRFLALFPFAPYKTAGALKAALAGLGVLVLVWHWWGATHGWPRRWVRDLALALTAILSAAGWWNFGAFHYAGGYLHYHEFFHYYLGSKYFHELEYTGLYDCIALAEVEAGRGVNVANQWTRDLTTNELRMGSPVLRNADLCRARFSTPERWESFKQDALWFHDRVTPQKWQDLLKDHGYNATPVWTIAGSLLANRAPASPSAIKRLALIDPFLMLMAFGLIWWAFGWRVLAVALMWWGTNYPARYTFIGGAFLREDWLLLTVASLCFAKRGWMTASGFTLTWAALLRIFPGFVAIGLIVQAMTRAWRERSLRLPVGYWRFAAGAIVALLLLIPLSFRMAAGPHGGVEAWRAFVDNSRKHLSTPLTNNVGLPMMLSFDPDTRSENVRELWLDSPWDVWKDARARVLGERRWLQVAIVAIFIALLAAAVRECDPWVALVLGLGAVPLLTNLTCYYYGFMMGFAALWLLNPLTGVALLALSLVTAVIPALILADDDRYTAVSLVIVLYVFAITVWFMRRGRSTTRVEPVQWERTAPVGRSPFSEIPRPPD
jgi:hypothetical protein